MAITEIDLTKPEIKVERPSFDENRSTRYLCAGVYLDKTFRHWVLRNVYARAKSRVAPSYGFNVVPVLAHARNAWLFETTQDGCLTILLLICAVYSAPTMAFLVTAAYLWFLGANISDYGRQRTRRFFRLPGQKQNMHQQSLHLAEERRRIKENLVIGLFLAAGTAVLTLWLHWGVLDVLTGVIPVAVLAAIVYAITEIARYSALASLRRGFGPVQLNRRLETIEEQQTSEVIPYADDPFIGNGQEVHRWAFSQRLLRATADENGPEGSEYADPPFKTRDLVRHIRDSLRELASNKGEETEIPGLQVSDLLFIEGRHLGPYSHLLGGEHHLEIHERFMADSRAPGRHHLACRVVSWGGEIVTAVHLHTSLQGGLLYLNYTTHALTPTPERFQMIDEKRSIGGRATAKAVLRKLVWTPRALIAPVAFCQALCMARDVLGSPRDRTLNVHHNVGVIASAREHLTTTRDRSYFQALDVAKHSKIIERRVISSVGDFLEGKVMTSEFRQRTTYILNSGVLNMGSGDITMGDNNTVGGDS